MQVGELCNRNVVFCKAAETLREAAQRMQHHHVGDLVVIEELPQGRCPIGILTDRDIVVGPVAGGADVSRLRVEEVMTRDLVTAMEVEDIDVALERMRARGVRRLPVVDAGGALQGILTFDDVLERLDEEMTSLVRLVAREQAREIERRP
jgi:CBS domain-containing protein